MDVSTENVRKIRFSPSTLKSKSKLSVQSYRKAKKWSQNNKKSKHPRSLHPQNNVEDTSSSSPENEPSNNEYTTNCSIEETSNIKDSDSLFESLFDVTRNDRRRSSSLRLYGNIIDNHPLILHLSKTYGKLVSSAEESKEELLPIGDVKSVLEALNEHEYRLFEKGMESWIQINGHKYHVIRNSAKAGSLYLSVARALTGSEKGSYYVKSNIQKEMAFCPLFYKEMGREMLRQIKSAIASDNGDEERTDFHASKSRLAKKYVRDRMANQSLQFNLHLSELTAAAAYYDFQYVLFDMFVDEETESIWIQLVHRDPSLWKTVDFSSNPDKPVYFFLRSGSETSHEIAIENIIPFRQPTREVLSSTTEVKLYNTIPVEKFHFTMHGHKSDEFIPKLFTDLRWTMTTFSSGHKNFGIRTTRSHDLWSVLSEVMHHNLNKASRLKLISDLSRFYSEYSEHVSKSRKRWLMKGFYTSNDKIEQMYIGQRADCSFGSGNVDDLDNLAAEYKFSYTLLGMDSKGHMFSRVIKHRSPLFPYDNNERNQIKYRHYAFFAKSKRDRKTEWYLLEDLGQNYELENSIYGDEEMSKMVITDLRDRPTLHETSYLKFNVSKTAELNGLNTSRNYPNQIITYFANLFTNLITVLGSLWTSLRFRCFKLSESKIHPFSKHTTAGNKMEELFGESENSSLVWKVWRRKDKNKFSEVMKDFIDIA